MLKESACIATRKDLRVLLRDPWHHGLQWRCGERCQLAQAVIRLRFLRIYGFPTCKRNGGGDRSEDAEKFGLARGALAELA